MNKRLKVACAFSGALVLVAAAWRLGAESPAPSQWINNVEAGEPLAQFEDPWALTLLPDERFLVTQRTESGALSVVDKRGKVIPVSGLPANIGLLDVKLAPDYSSSRMIYLTLMERDKGAARTGWGEGGDGLFPERVKAIRGQLAIGTTGAQLQNVSVVYEQNPFVVSLPGKGNPGGRITFSPDKQHMFLTLGDRQEGPRKIVSSLGSDLGKIVRLRLDGTVPADNPFATTSGARPAIWSLGHRNQYGLAFAPDGRMWATEMGPIAGDEMNLIVPGKNYGWPDVSQADWYDGTKIARHAKGDGFEAPKVTWSPSIAPAGMIFYRGTLFDGWQGDAIIAGLVSEALIRVEVRGNEASEVQRIAMGERVRDLVEAKDGSIWVLTDGDPGKLIKLTPRY